MNTLSYSKAPARRATLRSVPLATARRAVPGRLPNFLIVGAMKAGTTSLAQRVRAHPQVFMPASEGPEFFAAEPRPGRGLDWYRAHFAAAGPEALAVGEASSAYAKFPRYGGVPRRIAREVPDMRLIYIVRDPIERIRSQYQTRVAQGVERLPFEAAILADPSYLCYSRYALQIERYLEYFSPEQLLVVTYEDLRQRRHSVMERVYGFLGVDPGFVPADRISNLARQVDRIRTVSIGHRSAVPVNVTDDVRDCLSSLLASEVRSLRDHLGAGFDGWGMA